MAEKVSVTDLKKDQEKLQAELDRMGTYFQKKKEKPPEPMVKKEKDVPKDINQKLEQQLEESKKIMEKFDYLIDILLSTNEEGDQELDEVVYTLAQTQAHALVVLSNVKTLVEKTQKDMPSKQELEDFEQEQRERYNDLNQKVNLLLEKVEKPSYLKELDYIRVGVANIQSELKRLEGRVGGVDKMHEESKLLDERVQKVQEQVKKNPEIREKPKIKKEVNEMSTRVNNLEKTLRLIADSKRELEKPTTEQA